MIEHTDSTEYLYNVWLELQPPQVQAVMDRFRPWLLYRMSVTEQVVSVLGAADDGTITVLVEPGLNDILDMRTGCEVFGVDPNELEPWTPPLDG